MKRPSILTAAILGLVVLAVVTQGAATLQSPGVRFVASTMDVKAATSSVDSIEVEMQALQRGLVVVRETVIPADSEGAVQCQAVTTLALEATNGSWTVTNSRSRVDRKSCRLVG